MSQPNAEYSGSRRLSKERSDWCCYELLYETFRVITMINVADLKDPSDPQGRTYREVNNSTKHKYEVGELIEISSGARLFIAMLTRDCDGTPLYSLSYEPENEHYLFNGFSEDDMERV